ncbi:hypothetical protein VNI00_017415 [Paramarasmius palmivorus]|uniref:Uncharacterized protein n=1 Tax=Paramarasmius palmivorus TaxID=297713 RepID=A0AAW0B5F9_9AGAR
MDQLSDLTGRWDPRTPQNTQNIMQKVDKMARKGDQEDELRTHGMRPVMNMFLQFANFDPYRAVSFDDLHFADSGLWGAHLFPQLKLHLSKLGCHYEAKIDQRFITFPHWRDLNHFDGVTKISFNDGSKHRDISKLFLFAAQGVIEENVDRAGYQLLKCTRIYLNVIMYGGLHVHTSDTLAIGKEYIPMLSSAIEKYDHIPNTKPNEKMHGPLRNIYQRQTNFKDTSEQFVIADLIRDGIDELEDYQKHLMALNDDKIDSSTDTEGTASLGGIHFTIRSQLKALSFKSFTNFHSLSQQEGDQFQIDLADFMSKSLQANSIPLPGNQWIQYMPHEEV